MFTQLFSKQTSLKGELAVSYGAFGIGSAAGLLSLLVTSRYLDAPSFVKFAGAQALYLFVSSIIDGGYAYVMPKRISESSEQRTYWINATLRLRLVLSLVTGVVTSLSSFVVLANASPTERLLIGVYAVLSSCTPGWILQGLGRSRSFIAAEAIARLTSLLAILALQPKSLGGLLGALAIPTVASSAVLIHSFRNDLRVRHRSADFSYHKEAWSLLSGLIAARVYTRTPSLLAATMFSPGVAAGFLYVERIVRAATDVLAPLNQILLPRLVRETKVSINAARKELLSALKVSSPLFAAILIAAGVFAVVSNTKSKLVLVCVALFMASGAMSFLNSFIGLRWSVAISRADVVNIATRRALVAAVIVTSVSAYLRSPAVLAGSLIVAELTVYFSAMRQLRKSECAPW